MSKPNKHKPDSGSRTLRLARKELREILRDRRTVITLVLMPLLVYPLLGVIMRKGVLSNLTLLQTVQIHVATESEDVAAVFSSAMLQGESLLAEESTMEREEREDEQLDTQSLGGQPKFQFHVLTLDAEQGQESLRQVVGDGSADIAISLTRQVDGAFPNIPFFDWQILRRKGSAISERGFEEITKRLEAINELYNQRLLRSADLPLRKPANFETEIIAADGDGVSPLVTFIPLVLVLMTMTGAVYPAIDLTAGERERGTMEILVAAPVSRMTLLAGKFVAVLTVALLTASMNLVSMFATLFALGLEGTVLGNLSGAMIVQVIVLMVVFAAFFSAVLLSITSVARSFKEAQAYLIPLMLISLTPGVFSLMPNLQINSFLAVTPLVNTVLMGRDLLQGDVNLVMFAIVLISTAFYGVLALSLAARIFGSDAVLYSSGGTWSELLRRPDEESVVAPVTTAFGCLAVLFPLFILVNSLPSRLPISLANQMLVGSVILTTLFVLIPLLAALVSKTQFASGFALNTPSVTMCLVGLLLGCSLWVFVFELRISTLSSSHLSKLEQLYEQLELNFSAVPFWVKLTALAIAPAVCEELFFRGFLLNSLKQKTSRSVAVVVSAIVFGLFHVVVRDALMFERLLPSTLLGIVLGILFVRSNSVFPGMILHVVHNGLLVSIAQFVDHFKAWGIGVEDEKHLPVMVIVGAAAVVAIAAGLIFRQPQIKCEPIAESPMS